MALTMPEQLRFSGKNIIMVLYGLPGVGKTTLALSAPKAAIFDVDQGLVRVRPEHRKAAETSVDYETIIKTLESIDPKQYSTIIIDTMGALIDSMKEWAIKTYPSASRTNGGFSQQGFGYIKTEFARLSAYLRARFNVIFLFHATRTKGDDNEFYYDLICEGSAKVMVWQPADLGAYMFIENGKRFLGFSPTTRYSAKSGHGLKGLIQTPELNPGDPNDFLTKLFAEVKASIDKSDEAGAAEREAYEQIMAAGRAAIAKIKKAADVAAAGSEIKKLGSALTSTTELRALMAKHNAEKGIVWDKENKVFVDTKEPEPEPEAPAPEEPAAEEDGGGLL